MFGKNKLHVLLQNNVSNNLVGQFSLTIDELTVHERKVKLYRESCDTSRDVEILIFLSDNQLESD